MDEAPRCRMSVRISDGRLWQELNAEEQRWVAGRLCEAFAVGPARATVRLQPGKS